MLLWLWHRPAGTAPIRRLAWEAPYATGVALKKRQKDKKKKKIEIPRLCCHEKCEMWSNNLYLFIMSQTDSDP